MMRREAGFLALSLAEYFRDDGAHVMCLMDSLTRIAMAQREIGLAAGEPPATKGYTPSVFATLPALVERAGPGLDGAGAGHITGVFTVLVEGDDHDEPVADAARAILDGHIVLSRRIAERGRFPAVDILKSISRAMPEAVSEDEAALITEIKASASAYEDMGELIRIGAYRAGANPDVDRAIELHPKLEHFLTQGLAERISIDSTFTALKAAAIQDNDL
jgi:flagellum-specific ATP synthase